MPFYRQTIGGHFYKDYKNGNSKRVSEKEYLKNVRRVRGGAESEGETKKAVESKVVSSKKYTCECSCEKNENNNKQKTLSSALPTLTTPPVSTTIKGLFSKTASPYCLSRVNPGKSATKAS